MYHKGQVNQAINNLSKALSFYRWIEYDYKSNELPFLPKLNNPSTSKLQILMFNTFNDDNILLKENVGFVSEKDLPMQNSILFDLYSNLIAYYIKGSHIDEATHLLEDYEKLGLECSLYYFRLAQVIVADQRSTLDDLIKAQGYLEKSQNLKKSEKIYEHSDRMLKMFNLHDHQKIYEDFREVLGNLVSSKRSELSSIIDRVLLRAKEIENAEQDIISRGLVPEEGPEYDVFSFNSIPDFELTMLRGIQYKFGRALRFYTSDEKKTEFDFSKNEFLKLSKIILDFESYWNFNISSKNPADIELINQINQKYCIDIESDKIIKRIQRICREKSREIFERASLDPKMYSHVLEELLESRKNLEESQEQIEQPITQTANIKTPTKDQGYMRYVMMAILVVMIGIGFIKFL